MPVSRDPKRRSAEAVRVRENGKHNSPWRRFCPYLSERQWGTVREDYSAGGNAWDYFPHDHARSRAYRWGEDGLGGLSDHRQRLCLSLALWNERDPILKERLFGLTNGEGNHGEDVKEEYFYLDATPTASYLKFLYKYPQRAFPYAALVEGNRSRGRDRPELELLDVGAFDEDRYFDVFVEYAKADPNDIAFRIRAVNRGPDPAPLEILPHVWFRNTWSWQPNSPRPELRREGSSSVALEHPTMGRFTLYFDGDPELVFCENETNQRRLFGTDGPAHPKDAIGDYVVHGNRAAPNPEGRGTKCAARYRYTIPPGGEVTLRARLVQNQSEGAIAGVDAVVDERRREADEFYAELQAEIPDADQRLVQRQALAGMIWSKQFYNYEVRSWLLGDQTQP